MGDSDSVRSYCTRYLRPQISCLLKDLSRLQYIVHKREIYTEKRLEAGDTPTPQMSANNFNERERILNRHRSGSSSLADESNRRPKIGERRYVREREFNLARRDTALRSLVFERMIALSKLRAERETFIRDKRMLLNDLHALKEAVDNDRNRRVEEETRLKVLSRELDNKSSVLKKAQASIEELGLANQRLREKFRNLKHLEDEIIRVKESQNASRIVSEKRIEDLNSEIGCLNRRLNIANERVEIVQQEKDKLALDNTRLIEKNAEHKADLLEFEDRLEMDRKKVFVSKDVELRETAKKLQSAVNDIKSLERQLWQSKEDVETAKRKRQECLEKLTAEDALRRQTEEHLRKAKIHIDKLSQRHNYSKKEHILEHRERKELHKRIDYLRHTLRVQEKAAKTMKNTLRLLNVDFDDIEELEHVAEVQKNLEQEWNKMSRLEEKWKKIIRVQENVQCNRNLITKEHCLMKIFRQGVKITVFIALGCLLVNFIASVLMENSAI